MKKIKLGIIGAGWVARQHLEIISAFDWIQAGGIISRTRSKAEDLAREFKIPVCVDSLEALVEETKPHFILPRSGTAWFPNLCKLLKKAA